MAASARTAPERRASRNANSARVNRFIDELAADLTERGCSLQPDELKTALAQIFSAVMMPVLAPQLFEQHPGLDLRDPAVCRAYLARLVQRLLE